MRAPQGAVDWQERTVFSSAPGAGSPARRTAARILAWLPGFWLLLLVGISLAPWIVKRRLGISGIRHNRWHVVAFFVTAIVFTLGARTRRSGLFRLAGAAALTVLLESLETAVFGNPFEWKDVRLDLFGLVCGLLVVWLAGRITAPESPAS